MKTKFILSVSFAAVVMVPSLMAESPTERAFAQARAERDKAAAAVLDPVNRRYKEALDKLYRQAIEASDLVMAKQIQAELQAVGGSAAAANPGNPLIKPTAPPVNPADKTALKKMFENSEWTVSGNPNSNKISGSIVFLKGGKLISSGISHSRFYEVEAPDLLKLYDREPDAKELFRAFHVDMNEKTALMDLSISTREGRYFLRYSGPTKTKK